MIVTLTANPSVDRTLEVERLDRGAVTRATAHRVDPGGKGINVARALHASGHTATAVVPVGGAEGAQLLSLLERTGLPVVTVPIEGSVRANVTVVEPDGTVTKLNEPGPVLTPTEVEELLATTATAAAGASWLVLSGSLPPGSGPELFDALVRRAHAEGTAVAVDTSGPALRASLDAGPDLVKPNADELTELTQRALTTVGDAIDAARAVLHLGAGAVLASLGADGALLVTPDVLAHAEQPVAVARSTVGAGDATLAGYLSVAAEGGDPLSALRAAVTFGAAAVSLPGSQMPGPADLHLASAVVHTEPERSRRLSSPTTARHVVGAPTS